MRIGVYIRQMSDSDIHVSAISPLTPFIIYFVSVQYLHVINSRRETFKEQKCLLICLFMHNISELDICWLRFTFRRTFTE